VEQPLFVFAVLVLGLGLGSAVTAWVTRKPESEERPLVLQLKDGPMIDLGPEATPEDVEAVRQEWGRLAVWLEPETPPEGDQPTA